MRKGLVYRIIDDLEGLRPELRVEPLKGTTDAQGLVKIVFQKPFTELASIVSVGSTGMYRGRPCTVTPIEITLQSVSFQVMRTKAPVAAVAGAIVEVFEAAPGMDITGLVGGR